MMELLALLTLVVFGFVGFGILQKFLRGQSVGRHREMIHKERMAAMEKGLPIDSLGVDQELTMKNEVSGQNQEKVLVWVRLVALCLGLFFLLVGIGMCIAFHFAHMQDLNTIWTVGFIPVLGGIGLLLFVVLSRGFKSSL
jgi:hypothetical protein